MKAVFSRTLLAARLCSMLKVSVVVSGVAAGGGCRFDMAGRETAVEISSSAGNSEGTESRASFFTGLLQYVCVQQLLISETGS
jgi:hypothetical protein